MRIVKKPWGYEEIWAESSKYVGKLLYINAGQRLSKQYHEYKEETIYVLSGVLILEIGDEKQILKASDTYHISPGTIHRFSASACDVTLIEVSTPELDDVIRIEDDYARHVES